MPLLVAETGNEKIVFRHLDLGSLDSVTTWTRKHVATGKPLHILIDNAGIMATPLARTAEGFESQFGINHLGHFVFTRGLIPCLQAADGARVVCLSSSAHHRSDVDFADPNYRYRSYDPWDAYGQSKTAVALFAVGFGARWAPKRIAANAVNPGAIRTPLQRHLSDEDLAQRGWDRPGPPPGWKTPEQGAAMSVAMRKSPCAAK